MNKYLPIQNERLFEQIVGQIENRIMSGDLNVGDQLPPERELAEQFQVSRTAMREAIKILCEKGLIEIRTGRGTFVIHTTPVSTRQSTGLMLKSGLGDDPANLLEVREIMEPEIAALAASRIPAESVVALKEAYQVMEKACDNPAVFIEADQDFHLALAEAAQNPLIPAMMDSIIDMLGEESQQTLQVEGGLIRSQFYHSKILDVVLGHDPQAARLAMKEHLAQVRTDMETSLQRRD